MRLPKRSDFPISSRYAPLGLRDLPFPLEPYVNPYSDDPRRNGTIYAETTVSAEIEKFERLLIRPDDFPNRVRLAYLWAKGDQQSGRGMGKTALLRYFRQRINKDWGATEFGDRFSAVVIYVSFPSQVDRRYTEQLALSALVDVCKSGVLEASRAVLRLEQLGSEGAEKVMGDGSEAANLLKDPLLEGQGFEPAAIDDGIAKRLLDQGVRNEVAFALARGTFEDYLRTFRRDGSLEPFYVPRDTKILDYSRSLLFNEIVLFLREAGFPGTYLFIDDLENLVDQMTRRQRIEFAKEFALCTVRPGYANTAYAFLSCVLSTHQQASAGLAQAWAEAGLAATARLDPESPNSVELPLPSKDQAREIVVAHLDFYRSDPSERGSVKPFTEDGMETLLSRSQHPRILLASAAQVVQMAVEEGATMIDSGLVAHTFSASPPISLPDVAVGIEEAL